MVQAALSVVTMTIRHWAARLGEGQREGALSVKYQLTVQLIVANV